MNANPRLPAASALLPLLASLGLAACVPPPATQTAPRPAPAPAPAPTSRPAATPAPATPPASVDWRDAPVTIGEWRLVPTTDGLSADFANRFAMRCTRPANVIVITVRGPFTGPSGTIRVTTDTREQLLAARPGADGADGLAAALPARDPLLDAIAFSRGRFRVVTSDGRSLVMPTWTEISRVIEDCR